LNNAYFDAKAIKNLVIGNGFRFSKSMGQNFLIDGSIAEKLVNLSGIDNSCGVLEIGAGLGGLTSVLCQVAGRVLAVELDKRLIPVIRNIFSGVENVEIVQGDIMKLDVAKLVKEKMPDMRYQVCANLPYSITTPVLTMLINSKVFESITVMVQREVARRICAQPGSSDYGAFTVFAKYHATAETLFDVMPECFFPRPGVVSSVITMKTRTERLLEPEDEAQLFRVTRAAFGQRRKTLVNSLLPVFGNALQKTEIEEIVRVCGFDVRIRGEALSLEELMRVSARISAITSAKNKNSC